MSYDFHSNSLRCDRCGRYMRREPGTSWLFVPFSDMSREEQEDRCISCTAKYGKPMPHQHVVEHLCCGIRQSPLTTACSVPQKAVTADAGR